MILHDDEFTKFLNIQIYSNPPQWVMQWLPKKEHIPPTTRKFHKNVVLLLSFRLKRFCCATTCFILHLIHPKFIQRKKD